MQVAFNRLRDPSYGFLNIAFAAFDTVNEVFEHILAPLPRSFRQILKPSLNGFKAFNDSVLPLSHFILELFFHFTELLLDLLKQIVDKIAEFLAVVIQQHKASEEGIDKQQ
ncbi:unknown [Clostridium sp. CAG:413]|nr:unknown [Clostridium sp. CAG:413]